MSDSYGVSNLSVKDHCEDLSIRLAIHCRKHSHVQYCMFMIQSIRLQKTES